MGVIRDQRVRKKKRPTCGFVVFEDIFLSGNGRMRGISYYAIEANTDKEVGYIVRNGKRSASLYNCRFVTSLRGLKALLGRKDDMSIVDKKCAGKMYKKGWNKSGA